MNRPKSILAGVDISEGLRAALKHTREVRADLNGDLIIFGNNGRTNLRCLMLGATAERWLTELPCSVLCVRAQEGASA